MSDPPIERALISVSDKQGVVDIARALIEMDVEVLSTGGTKKHLDEAGIAARDISDYTEFPEMMSGRLKTLHPRVHGGILCRHDLPEEMETIQAHGILKIPLIVVNLYPFEETVAQKDVTVETAIENIDIGGPTMIRAAAKNFRFTTVVTSPDQYQEVIEQLHKHGSTTLALRRKLAVEAFAKTSRYDQAITAFFTKEGFHNGEDKLASENKDGVPEILHLELIRKASLRYGENPHQQAELYQYIDSQKNSLVAAQQLNGKELSYNNLLDLESALRLVKLLPESAAVVIKHNNPCGASCQPTLRQAAELAFEGDPESAFGSILGFNREVDAETAEFLIGPEKFIEGIVAPSFHPTALEILTTRPKWKLNVRLLETGSLSAEGVSQEMRSISGGLLLQESDTITDDPTSWKIVTDVQPSDKQSEDLRFVWTIVRQVKSNAIVIGKETTLWGSGAGQMSRIDAVALALKKAAEKTAGCVLASDAFFPFADSIEQAAAAGIAAIIQPGGSRRDGEVIAACNQHKLPMIFTGRRHFKH